MKNKWSIALAATLMLAVTWQDGDRSQFSSLSAADYLPVMVISAVIFLLKTGILSALLLMVKKLWEKLRN